MQLKQMCTLKEQRNAITHLKVNIPYSIKLTNFTTQTHSGWGTFYLAEPILPTQNMQGHL